MGRYLTFGERIREYVFPILLFAMFILSSVVSALCINDLNGNARVINYTGIVRGATQRLIKKELNHRPDDALIERLDGILRDLIYGQGDNSIVPLRDDAYQSLMGQMEAEWADIKEEILLVRAGGDSGRLFDMSEDYFELADRTVAAAEEFAQCHVTEAQYWMAVLNVVFIVVCLLFVLYGRRQARISRELLEAEAASRGKSRFLSSVSHEIRTPMNGIIGMTAMAKRSVGDKERVTDCLDKIDLSAQFLMALINDVLDMSRIESGKLELHKKPSGFDDMIRGITTMLAPKAVEQGVELTVDAEGISGYTVLVDPLRLEQILINLISNAIKFTPEGGRVSLEARCLSWDGRTGSFRFVVTDTGIGMKKEFLAHVFEPFVQEDRSDSRQYGGTGLGLAISYQLVRQMKGELSVDSEPGKGSRFTVDLPLELAPEAVRIQETAPDSDYGPYDFGGKRILIAEDNEINAEIVLAFLEDTGALLTHVWNGREAVEAFTAPSGGFDLILMDIQMPVMDGLTATRAIRSSHAPGAAAVPIIALTANAFTSDREKARECGVTAYLSKPLDERRLRAAIHRLLYTAAGRAGGLAEDGLS